ncbi:MAG: hypothetical protein R3C56_35920 [Pirellulaceae bacterium]
MAGESQDNSRVCEAAQIKSNWVSATSRTPGQHVRAILGFTGWLLHCSPH